MQVIIECVLQQILNQQTIIQMSRDFQLSDLGVMTKTSLDSLLRGHDNSLIYGCLVLIPYAILLIKKVTRARLISLLAFLLCSTITVLFYKHLNDIELYSIFSIIYAMASLNTKHISTSFWCCVMGILNITMAMDTYYNAKIETFIWENYETIVYIVHFLIIASFSERFTKWCRDSMDFIITNLHSLYGNKVNY